MESGIPSYPYIFFKDKKKELRGPMAERITQEFYRHDLFDGSYTFCTNCVLATAEVPRSGFLLIQYLKRKPALMQSKDCVVSKRRFGAPCMPTYADEYADVLRVMRQKKAGERPTIRTLIHTIDALRLHNGRAPLKLPSNERRVISLHKHLNVHVECPTTSMSENAAEKKDGEGGTAANKYSWLPAIDECALFFMDLLEFFRIKKEPEINVEFIETELRISLLNENEQRKLNSNICGRMKLNHVFLCMLCERFMFSYRHVFMHIACPDHIKKVDCKSPSFKRANELLIAMVGEETRTNKMVIVFIFYYMSWIAEETEDVRLHRNSWPSMSLEHPELRPKKHYVETLEKIFRMNASSLSDDAMVQLVEHVFCRSPGKSEFHNLLLSHIGMAKARCFQCKLVFDNKEEYFKHLTTFAHLRETDHFDMITAIANLAG